jgi:hypothetical protein
VSGVRGGERRGGRRRNRPQHSERNLQVQRVFALGPAIPGYNTDTAAGARGSSGRVRSADVE